MIDFMCSWLIQDVSRFSVAGAALCGVSDFEFIVPARLGCENRFRKTSEKDRRASFNGRLIEVCFLAPDAAGDGKCPT